MIGQPYEHYSCPCPRCGHPESRDDGPYNYIPWLDDDLGGRPDPRVHLLWCRGCGKPFDAIDYENRPTMRLVAPEEAR